MFSVFALIISKRLNFMNLRINLLKKERLSSFKDRNIVILNEFSEKMSLESLDKVLLTKFTSQLVDNVTCLECCQYYIAPETAGCGHTLCHTCWRGRRTCPSCAAPLERSTLKLNLPIQTRTKNIQTLGEIFQKLFGIKLDEFILDVPSEKSRSLSDPSNNVKDWLASSQNHFSGPLLNSELNTQEVVNPLEISKSKIQIHSVIEKRKCPEKVILVQQVQDDWDKIEALPDTEELTNKPIARNSNDAIYSIDHENEYNADFPRRSSRKRGLNQSEPTIKPSDISLEKPKSKNSHSENEKNLTKEKIWNNVKKMRKEFSKLNKKNKSKLNVSIEMCKRTQINANKINLENEKQILDDKESQPPVFTIEDHTPSMDYDKCNNDKLEKDNNDNNSINRKNSNEIEMDVINDENIVSNDVFPNSGKSKKSIPQSDNIIDQNECSTNIKNTSQNRSTKMPFFKKGDLCPVPPGTNNMKTININNDLNQESRDSEDIEITIKIGSTLTNIVIKKKTSDIQLKVNTDREVQTSLGENHISTEKVITANVQDDGHYAQVDIGSDESNVATRNNAKSSKESLIAKSVSTKKNTASAETSTAQFEITESAEKELSNIMECEESANKENISKVLVLATNNAFNQSFKKNIKDNVATTNQAHEIAATSQEQQNVHLIKKGGKALSEILVPSTKSTKINTQTDKRNRENDGGETPVAKKFKSSLKITEEILNNDNVNLDTDSINYDVVMGQLFANIDADIEKSQRGSNKTDVNHKTNSISQDDVHDPIFNSEKPVITSQVISNTITKVCSEKEKYSENVFSILEREGKTNDMANFTKARVGCTQQHTENLLTPEICDDLGTLPDDLEANKDICTPYHDDSDKSVVEETPQKEISITRQKSRNETNVQQTRALETASTKTASDSQILKSIINVSDSFVDSEKTSKEVTVVEGVGAVVKKNNLETPLTINKFVNHIKHNSTPVARKSLTFENKNNEDDVDPEQTLFPSFAAVKTTQEKEIMSKAFEQSPKSPLGKVLASKNVKGNEFKYCLAGSCLSASELTNVKMLCRKKNWRFVDKYTKELTHLIVSVDEGNMSQRSVKYMCALAGSKWIVSYQWIDTCIKTNLIVGEHHYEVLDSTGEPGPKRSRLAKNKLFEGIIFYCMPPFSILDLDCLKEMLVSSGGTVTPDAAGVRATERNPAFLLAEPENTQEDRFMYLALELGIVPVNYEWVLNCLGSYTLSSVHDLLLCPGALLPPATSKWPAVLMSRDSE